MYLLCRTELRKNCASLALAAVCFASLAGCGSADSSTGRTADGADGAGAGVDSAGGASGLAAEPGTLDPCSLLSEDELEQLISTDLTPTGPAVDEARGRSCKWTFKDPGAVVEDGTLNITTWHGSQFFLDVAEAENLPGVGDENYYEPTIDAVTFLAGDDVFVVQGGNAKQVAQAISDSL